MSVEVSSPSVSPKTVAAADSRSGVAKGKTGTSQGAADAAPGGFLALLTAFEAPETLASLPGDGASELPLEVPDGAVTPAILPDNTPLNEVPWSELSLLLGQKMPADLASPPGDASGAGGALPVMASLSTSEKFATPALPKTDGLVPTEPFTGGAAGGKPGAAGRPLVSTDTAEPVQATDWAAFTAPVDAGLPDVAQQGLAVRSRKGASADPQSLAAVNAAESRALKPTAFMDLVAQEPTLSGALVASGLSSETLSPTARPPGRSFSGVAATGLEGSFAQYALSPGASTDAASAATGPVLSPESAVAEQVTYWVSQGIQNAQLKLEGFGAEPVEVNISLKGQEAQIDFRTDQPEVRQMLEGALTQLKETLAREGLVLSGVSVGASGQDGSGAQERRQQPEARQTTVLPHEAGATVGLQRSTPSAGRALDVFV